MAKTLVYQMYPISFKDIDAMTRHLFMVSQLGADYVWLSPLYLSPRKDHGYDVANYEAIDPRFGTFSDFEKFIKIAHKYGIGVVMDLVVNHTSTSHRWFRTNPSYYCWSDSNRPGWKNLFDNGPAWRHDDKTGKYYLHLFHEEQADLNWFPDGKHINHQLVKEFRKIVHFWMEFGVDGFRIDIPQGINKDLSSDTLVFSDLLFGYKGAEVISEIFRGFDPNPPFLMMECFDPSYGGLTEFYTENTPVDFVLNVLIKQSIAEGEAEFEKITKASSRNPHFMLDLESHDSPRFPSYGVKPEDALQYLFGSGAEGICLYQGQELGLSNPTPRELPNEQLLAMDAESLMRCRRGEHLSSIRPTSRANARVPLPSDEHMRQLFDPNSYFSLTKDWITRWKNS